tara:strand:+ start:6223 stop:6657 length:435 start_codon:yes stop_codon:yes gene_type:complete
MLITGMVERMKKRKTNQSYSQSMDIYEQTLNQLVQSDSRSKRTNELDDKDFRLKVGDVVGVRCPDDDRYYVTAFIKLNPSTQQLQSLLSNPVFGNIPPGIREVSPHQLYRQMRLPNTQGFNAFGTRPSEEVLNNHQRWSQGGNQ